jgi:hypothetical protein
MGQPQSLQCHVFLFNLACSAADILLLLHQQIIHSFHGRPVRHAIYQGHKFREREICWQPGQGHYDNTIIFSLVLV